MFIKNESFCNKVIISLFLYPKTLRKIDFLGKIFELEFEFVVKPKNGCVPNYFLRTELSNSLNKVIILFFEPTKGRYISILSKAKHRLILEGRYFLNFI